MLANAICFRSGQIFVLPFVPKGAIKIAVGPLAKLRRIIEGTARLSRDNHTWLVPGIPEAADTKSAMEALSRYSAQVAMRLGGESC